MARNELTRGAMQIADLIRSKSAERTDKSVADAIDIPPSTLCRFKSEHLDKFCAFLDELGLVVREKDAESKRQQALIVLAEIGLQHINDR
ncbi:hypothetical protein [Haemophilus parahaemolyticus]|jgi:hypothetical protein|uniref:hypothetical protein n=1 Tax=Haemophilus parahaemolyticus TaxID=735 RepID=UPI0024932D5D|nr:hypothetical protein [Haemophilus parahaemolyticus]